jgi:methylaspartate mutase sigma subunit
MSQPTIILGVIGSDVHVVGNRILAYALTEAGFNVVNMGVMVAQEEFIAAAVETNADAILVGSLYGQGEIDCRGMRGKCEEMGVGDILLYVGGNLVVGKHDWQSVRERFEKEMSFDRAFPSSTDSSVVVDALRQDLAARITGRSRQ